MDTGTILSFTTSDINTDECKCPAERHGFLPNSMLRAKNKCAPSTSTGACGKSKIKIDRVHTLVDMFHNLFQTRPYPIIFYVGPTKDSA
jgi:hypothetical protein